ncbi:DHA2 family efflux MFS transporter permease subunit [Bifidobacterium vespertilionis]|uniref:DHA2 family efflux MFS transporter permease subunit n=1 Tax=Bifidobacterium vespertilionis TaxID=2562524 RepID=A0A5J5DSV0_9BIFI|nr:DHA2 family efflux MFS transporter permease subunit [Bifidobacterium vespertilionis]KAA8816801.1 DHA2 family efflux MFS transporter permease subunit [Bifidobacterium vespertilionis]KAA8821834.1 DHA2 family efflux MFS transporter permease subunit [Bifidobacterium vespertilionis]
MKDTPNTAAATGKTGITGKRPVARRLIIAVVALAILTFLGILSETSLNIAYSTLMAEFSISADVVQWLTTGYLLLLSVAIPASPFMVRRFATKTLFVAAVLIFAAGTLIGALAVNFPMLLAARLVMALGTGISLPLITNIILEKAPLEQRGMMLGIVSLVTCAAPPIGPVFGGVVMEYLNWHWIFYTMLPFLAIAFALGLVSVPEIRHEGDAEGATISVPSMLLVAVGLAALIVSVSFFAEWNGDWRFWGVLALAVAALALFVWMQLRMDRPLVQVRVFAHPGFTLGMLILLMASGGVLGLNFLLPILLQRGFGMGSLEAALVLLPGAAVGAISAPLIGGMLKNHFPPKFIVIGFAVTTLMDLVFVFRSGSVWTVAVAYAAFMAFSGFVLVPDQTHALNQLPARLNADGSAVMNTVQQLAGAIGTAVASTLITEFSAAAPYPQAFSASMRVFAGLALAGVALAALMFRFSVRRPPEMTLVEA